MARKQVTVVVPAFRSSATIERTVRSVFGQPSVECRVIVVVDDDEGKVEEVLSTMRDERLAVLTNETNMGAQKSRNRGLALVESDYVMFLDSDDFVMGDLLDGLAGALDAGADIAFGPWLSYDDRGNHAMHRHANYAGAADLLDRWLVRREWTPPCAVLWRTGFVRRIGGWNEAVRRNQDGEIVCRAVLAGARLGHSEKGGGIYVQHDSPLRVSRNRSTFGDLLDVADSLLVQPTSALPESRRRKIMGDYFYWLADSAFRRGNRIEGLRAMRRAARLGGKLRVGSPVHRIGAGLLGLETWHGMTARMRGASDR